MIEQQNIDQIPTSFWIPEVKDEPEYQVTNEGLNEGVL